MTFDALRSLRPISFALIAGLLPAAAQAAEHSLDGVNFMGPLITPNPAGMPKGNLFIEPYLVRIDSDRYFDGEGRRHDSDGRSAAWLTVVPIAYGLGQRVTAQVNLSASRAETGGDRSRGFRAGDTTAMVQYLLQAPNEDGTRPAISVSLSQRYATGSYDRIDGNPLNAQGDGVQRTTFGLGMQQVVWLLARPAQRQPGTGARGDQRPQRVRHPRWLPRQHRTGFVDRPVRRRRVQLQLEVGRRVRIRGEPPERPPPERLRARCRWHHAAHR